jgi:hypothetical protein
MSDIPRREISELLVRYELEPSIRDVFVEGQFDRDVLSRAAGTLSKAQRNLAIYSIDSVNVPSAHLVEYGLTDGNKQRLIALAKALAARSPGQGYVCVVDRDLDHWFDSIESIPGLRWTLYTSIELYFFSEERLREVLETAACASIPDWQAFFGSLRQALFELYALRLAERSLSLSLSWISFERCLERDGSRVSFDLAEFSRRLLNASSLGSRLLDWGKQVSAWTNAHVSDVRMAIRGHDLIDLLAWSVRKFSGRRQFADAVSIERLLVLLADREVELTGLLI